LCGVLSVLLLLAPAVSFAKPTETELEKLAQEISETTMSPFCPGRTLSACPSGQARDLRGKVRQWLVEGYSKEAVRNRLLTIYGDDVRGTPRAEGFGLMAWLMPAFFVALCLLFVVFALRHLRAVDQVSDAEPADPGLRRRVEDELKKRMQ